MQRAKELQKAGKIFPNPKVKRFTKAEALRTYGRLMEEQREQMLKTLVEEIPNSYHLIQTKDELKWVCELWDNEPIIGLDAVYSDNKSVGLSITFPISD